VKLSFQMADFIQQMAALAGFGDRTGGGEARLCFRRRQEGCQPQPDAGGKMVGAKVICLGSRPRELLDRDGLLAAPERDTTEVRGQSRNPLPLAALLRDVQPCLEVVLGRVHVAVSQRDLAQRRV
jgi:hypothetical protein